MFGSKRGGGVQASMRWTVKSAAPGDRPRWPRPCRPGPTAGGYAHIVPCSDLRGTGRSGQAAAMSGLGSSAGMMPSSSGASWNAASVFIVGGRAGVARWPTSCRKAQLRPNAGWTRAGRRSNGRRASGTSAVPQQVVVLLPCSTLPGRPRGSARPACSPPAMRCMAGRPRTRSAAPPRRPGKVERRRWRWSCRRYAGPTTALGQPPSGRQHFRAWSRPRSPTGNRAPWRGRVRAAVPIR